MGSPRLSPDELTIYFHGYITASDSNLFVAQRSAIDQPFGPPTELTAVDSTADELNPTVSSNGLILLFTSNRVANQGFHLYVSIRTSTLGDFGPPNKLSGVNSSTVTDGDQNPYLAPDGQTLWFASNRSGGAGEYDLYRATKSGTNFANPQKVGALNGAFEDWNPAVSADGLTIYFTSDRPDGTNNNIWTAHRSTTSDGFPTPKLVTEVSSSGNDYAGWLSADNCRLYFSSSRAGQEQIYVATRQP